MSSRTVDVVAAVPPRPTRTTSPLRPGRSRARSRPRATGSLSCIHRRRPASRLPPGRSRCRSTSPFVDPGRRSRAPTSPPRPRGGYGRTPTLCSVTRPGSVAWAFTARRTALRSWRCSSGTSSWTLSTGSTDDGLGPGSATGWTPGETDGRYAVSRRPRCARPTGCSTTPRAFPRTSCACTAIPERRFRAALPPVPLLPTAPTREEARASFRIPADVPVVVAPAAFDQPEPSGTDRAREAFRRVRSFFPGARLLLIGTTAPAEPGVAVAPERDGPTFARALAAADIAVFPRRVPGFDPG